MAKTHTKSCFFFKFSSSPLLMPSLTSWISLTASSQVSHNYDNNLIWLTDIYDLLKIYENVAAAA